MSRWKRFGAAAVSVLTLLLAVRSASAESWRSSGALYGWLAGIDGTVAAGTSGPMEAQASFSDLAKYLDFSFAGHFESQTRKALLLGDVWFVDLGATRDFDTPSGVKRGELDFKEWIIEGGGAYRISPTWDLLVVGRYNSLNTSAMLGEQTIAEKTRGWMDVFVGARYRVSQGRWIASVRGDIGTGGSDVAWFGNAGLAYRLSQKVSLGAGYRILSVDYETGEGADYFRYDIVQDGVGIMLGFNI